MTPAEITAHVMAMSHEQVDRACAVDVMGWKPHGIYSEWYAKPDGYIEEVDEWHPSTDRNQSRMVTDRVRADVGSGETLGRQQGPGDENWWDITPLDESRAALIAHYTHKGGIE